MARIDDDPLAAALRQSAGRPDHPRKVAVILASAAAATINPLAAVLLAAANSLRQYFSQTARAERLKAFFGLVVESLDRLNGRLDELECKVQSPGFLQALLTAVDESSTTLNEEKLRRFASVLGYALVKGGNQPDWDEAESYLRDVGRLTEADIQALRVLQEHGAEAWIECARLGKQYLENLFVHCFRLTGFGLAFSKEVSLVTQNGSPIFYGDDKSAYDGIDWRSLPEPLAFRLSSRGERLIKMLSADEASSIEGS